MANHEQDLLWVQNPTKEDFTVIWGRYPYSVKAGAKQIFPRFIANHFAKHLTDKILLQKEAAYKAEHGKDKTFINSKTHRPETVNTILVGVYQYFTQGGEDPQAAIARQVAEANQQTEQKDDALDLGDIDQDPVLGNLQDDEDDDEPVPSQPADITQQPPAGHTLTEAVQVPETQQTTPPTAENQPNAINQGEAAPTEDILQQTAQQTSQQYPPQAPAPQSKPKPNVEGRSINELRKEAKVLGLKITGRESKPELVSMIQNF